MGVEQVSVEEVLDNVMGVDGWRRLFQYFAI